VGLIRKGASKIGDFHTLGAVRDSVLPFEEAEQWEKKRQYSQQPQKTIGGGQGSRPRKGSEGGRGGSEGRLLGGDDYDY